MAHLQQTNRELGLGAYAACRAQAIAEASLSLALGFRVVLLNRVSSLHKTQMVPMCIQESRARMA